MKLVAENTDKDLARERAQSAFQEAVVDLTANLLRIARGAGASYDVGKQAARLIKSMEQHWEAFGHYPSGQAYHDALGPSPERHPEYGSEQQRSDALEQIMRGGLQVVASRLLEQHLQIAAGEREMETGLRHYAEWQEEMRQERRRIDSAARAADRQKKARTGRKPGPKPKTPGPTTS